MAYLLDAYKYLEYLVSRQQQSKNLTSFSSYPLPGELLELPYPVHSNWCPLKPDCLKECSKTTNFKAILCFHGIEASLLKKIDASNFETTSLECGLLTDDPKRCPFYINVTKLLTNNPEINFCHYGIPHTKLQIHYNPSNVAPLPTMPKPTPKVPSHSSASSDSDSMPSLLSAGQTDSDSDHESMSDLSDFDDKPSPFEPPVYKNKPFAPITIKIPPIASITSTRPNQPSTKDPRRATWPQDSMSTNQSIYDNLYSSSPELTSPYHGKLDTSDHITRSTDAYTTQATIKYPLPIQAFDNDMFPLSHPSSSTVPTFDTGDFTDELDEDWMKDILADAYPESSEQF